jgi:hypothetical protein
VIQASIIHVTGSGIGIFLIIMTGGGTRTHGGKTIITTEGTANIGVTVVLRSGDSVLGDITAACTIAVASAQQQSIVI